MPDIEALPILTPIPITLNITTLSKPGKQDEWPADKPIFPSPPLTPDLVDFRLQRRVHISTYQLAATSTDHFVSYIGGLGPGLSEVVYNNVQVDVMDNVWIPSVGGDEKTQQKGQWKQEVTFKSFIRLASPPTFNATTMAISVRLPALLYSWCNAFNDLDLTYIIVLDAINCEFPGNWERHAV